MPFPPIKIGIVEFSSILIGPQNFLCPKAKLRTYDRTSSLPAEDVSVFLFLVSFSQIFSAKAFSLPKVVLHLFMHFVGVYIYTYNDCGRRDLMQRPWRGMTHLITVSYFRDRFVVQDHAKHVEPFCVELWLKSHCRKEVMIQTQKKICCRIKILSQN